MSLSRRSDVVCSEPATSARVRRTGRRATIRRIVNWSTWRRETIRKPGIVVAALHLRRDQIARGAPPAQRLLGRDHRDHVELADPLRRGEGLQMGKVEREREQVGVVLDQDRAPGTRTSRRGAQRPGDVTPVRTLQAAVRRDRDGGEHARSRTAHRDHDTGDPGAGQRPGRPPPSPPPAATAPGCCGRSGRRSRRRPAQASTNPATASPPATSAPPPLRAARAERQQAQRDQHQREADIEQPAVGSAGADQELRDDLAAAAVRAAPRRSSCVARCHSGRSARGIRASPHTATTPTAMLHRAPVAMLGQQPGRLGDDRQRARSSAWPGPARGASDPERERPRRRRGPRVGERQQRQARVSSTRSS